MQNLEEKKYWVWFSLLQIGSIKKQELLRIYDTPKKIYKLDKSRLLKQKGIGEKTADKILDESIRQNLDKHIKYMINNNIDILSIYDSNYPNLLKEIYDYPISIYIKGNKRILNRKSISIVGCRQVSDYGKKVAKYFSYYLAKKGINIVSGLAKGVDSYAHIGSVYAKKVESYQQFNKLSTIGDTIAVLGNGLDMIYPQENYSLAETIVDIGGAIISEYPLGTKPKKMNFPARNRIISGLSSGVIVVEAKEKSGTLITVDFALEQGRDVFVVPGNIDCVNSFGTNELLKQGAKLINCYEDIIEYFKGQ